MGNNVISLIPIIALTFKLISNCMNASRQNQFMHGSSPLYPHDGSKSNLESDSESTSKTATKFPPIKAKIDQTPNLKENQKDVSPSGFLMKKVNEETAINGFKKTNQVIKKRGDKKKDKFIDIKPQILEKYKQYLDFTSLVNLTNNLKIQVTERVPSYVLYVGKGNNSSLIKNLFKAHRPWWTIEETFPDNPSINMFWYQLRQNEILDNFKENMKTEIDFQDCSYYAQVGEQKPQMIGTEKQVREQSSRSNHKQSQVRSQSVTQKDIKFTAKLAKRSSSRTKGISQQKTGGLTIPLVNLDKQVKDEIEGEQLGKKKKVLANPKMWPIYNNYRRLFSQHELKQIKKLKVIQQDGKINVKLSRNKIKYFENRSNYFKMHNHVTNNWNLSNKKALFMNLKSYYQAQKINPFDFIPMTFHITDVNDKQFLKFQDQYERRNDAIRQEEKKQKNQQFKYGFKPKKRNAWLVKPGENTNRGNGIEVVESLEQIKDIIERDRVDTLGRQRTHIVQQYIMPFLYQKRKFDIRCYVCLTSINGYQKGYWFQDGYIRTASKQFNMKNLNNKFIHLTNDAVQKHHEDYGKFQPANKLSYADFQRYLDTVYNSNNEGGQKFKFYQQAYPEMKKLAGDIFRSVYTKINPTKKEFTFEVFGLDYMIDQNFKVWLIQVNTNPCLELACPLLGRVIPTMLENAFKLVVDPIFPPPAIEELVSLGKRLTLPENLLENNKFELIFDEAEEGRELKMLLSSAPQVKIFQVQEQQDEEYDENGNECCEKPVKQTVLQP